MNIRAAWKALFSSGKVPPPNSGIGRGYGGIGYQLNRLLPGAKLDYAQDAAERWRNVAVAACLRWLMENAGQACLVAKEEEPNEDGEGLAEIKDTVIHDDPIVAMIESPNPYMTMEELVGAFLMSDRVDGNSYFLIANGSNGAGSPQQIWWVPWWMIGPYTEDASTNFIDGYWYQPGDGSTRKLPMDMVIHIKNGVDPYDQRYGCSALKAAGDRSLVMLNDCETYGVAVVRNGGPLRLFIPDSPDLDMDDAKAEGIKGKIRRGTRGENAASVEVLNEPGRVEQVGSGPQELALETLPNRPESNICSLMGVDAQVAGLAAGQGTRTFDNYGEAEGHAWKNSLVPSLKRFASAFTKRFMGDTGRWLEWDYSEVKALAEDEGAKIANIVAAVGGPVMTVDEGRARLGLPPATPAQMEEIVPPPPPALDPNADPNADPASQGNANEGANPNE